MSGAKVDVLLPCPFCGGESEMRGEGALFYVCCDPCGTMTSHYAAPHHACDAWNRRPSQANAVGERAAPPDNTALLADIRKAAGDSRGRLMQDELVARIAGMALNDACYRWLRERYVGVDFEYMDTRDVVLIFRVDPKMRISGNLDATISDALAATKPQGSADRHDVVSGGNEGGGA